MAWSAARQGVHRDGHGRGLHRTGGTCEQACAAGCGGGDREAAAVGARRPRGGGGHVAIGYGGGTNRIVEAPPEAAVQHQRLLRCGLPSNDLVVSSIALLEDVSWGVACDSGARVVLPRGELRARNGANHRRQCCEGADLDSPDSVVGQARGPQDQWPRSTHTTVAPTFDKIDIRAPMSAHISERPSLRT